MAIWRSVPRRLIVHASLCFAAVFALMALYFLPISRPRSPEVRTTPAELVGVVVTAVAGLVGALVLLSILMFVAARKRPRRPSTPSDPQREANEAVMPIPGETPRDAVGRETA